MPTPYERYRRGWGRAEEEVARRKQLGFQERGLGLQEERFGLEQEKWPVQKSYMEAQTGALSREEPVGLDEGFRAALERVGGDLEKLMEQEPGWYNWAKLSGKYTFPEEREATEPTEAAKERSALGFKPSQTPHGRKVQLQAEGYRVDAAGDKWLPPTEKTEADDPSKDPVFKMMYEGISTKMMSDPTRKQRGVSGPLSVQEIQQAMREAYKQYQLLQESLPNPEYDSLFR